MKDKPADLITEMRQVGDHISKIESEAGLLSAKLEDGLLRLPNLPSEDVSIGRGSEDNIEVRSWGKPREFTFTSASPLGPC